MSTASESKKTYDTYTKCFSRVVSNSNQARKLHIRLTGVTITATDELRYDFVTRPEPDRDVTITHIVDKEYQSSDDHADLCPWRLAYRDVLEELKTSDEAASVLDFVLAANMKDTFALGMSAKTFSVDGSVEKEAGGETHRVLLIAPFSVVDPDGSEAESACGSAPVSVSGSGEEPSSGEPTVGSVSSWLSSVDAKRK